MTPDLKFNILFSRLFRDQMPIRFLSHILLLWQTLMPLFALELYSTEENIHKLTAQIAAPPGGAAAGGGETGEGEEGEGEAEAGLDPEELEEMEFELSDEKDRLEAIKDAAGAILGAVSTAGVNFLCSELGKQVCVFLLCASNWAIGSLCCDVM